LLSQAVHRFATSMFWNHTSTHSASRGTATSKGSVALVVGKVGQTWLMKVPVRPGPRLPPTSAFAGFRFPAEVIVVAVRWYLRYNLSYRDVEELLVERGVEVDHVSVFRWVQRFTPLLADAARFARLGPGDRWVVGGSYGKV